VVVGIPGDSSPPMKYGPISSTNGNGVVDTEVATEAQSLVNATITSASNQTVLMFTKALAESGETAFDVNGENTMAFAIGGDSTWPSYHSGGRNIFLLNLASETEESEPAMGSAASAAPSLTASSTGTLFGAIAGACVFAFVSGLC